MLVFTSSLPLDSFSGSEVLKEISVVLEKAPLNLEEVLCLCKVVPMVPETVLVILEKNPVTIKELSRIFKESLK